MAGHDNFIIIGYGKVGGKSKIVSIKPAYYLDFHLSECREIWLRCYSIRCNSGICKKEATPKGWPLTECTFHQTVIQSFILI